MVALLALSVVLGTTVPEKGAIAGTIETEAGRPLKGATVFISTAAPRKGVGVL